MSETMRNGFRDFAPLHGALIGLQGITLGKSRDYGPRSHAWKSHFLCNLAHHAAVSAIPGQRYVKGYI